MTVKAHESTHGRVDIDLTNVPYFPTQREPLVLQEASGLERVRNSVEVDETAPIYRVHREPTPGDGDLYFGGLGLAAVMDVGAHPIRAQLRRVNVLTVFAITAVMAVLLIMATVVATFRH